METQEIKLDTPTLRKLIGKRVKYLLKRDRYSGVFRGGYFGTITDVVRKQVEIEGDYHTIDAIEWIRLA
jgi:hypothetical protein